MARELQQLGDGPFGTREQAEIRYAGFCRAALSGVSGPPGEQLVYAAGQLERETLIDLFEVLGVELGDYDRQVIARLARLLGPLDSAVVDSLFKRVARDDYNQAEYIATGRRPRHLWIVTPEPDR